MSREVDDGLLEQEGAELATGRTVRSSTGTCWVVTLDRGSVRGSVAGKMVTSDGPDVSSAPWTEVLFDLSTTGLLFTC